MVTSDSDIITIIIVTIAVAYELHQPAYSLVLKIHYSTWPAAVYIVSLWVDRQSHDHAEDLLCINCSLNAIQNCLRDAIFHTRISHTSDKKLQGKRDYALLAKRKGTALRQKLT